MKDCELLEQLRKALEQNTGVRVYIPMPTFPANALSNRDGYCYYSHRAYLNPEARKYDKKSVFILTEVKCKEFTEQGVWCRRPVLVVSLCEGCGCGWSTWDAVTIDPQNPDSQDAMFGHAALTTFCWEGQKITVCLS